MSIRKRLGLTIATFVLSFVVAITAVGIAFASLYSDVGSSFLVIYSATDELWNAKYKFFNKENFVSLLKVITGNNATSLTNLTELDRLAKKFEPETNIRGTTSEEMRGFSVGKNAGENIVVLLGGLSWYATYLSTDVDGNIILTLWLNSCQQDAFNNAQYATGEYYGFIDGALFSDWAANWAENDPYADYPSSMYGTSYVRSVTLNNGGAYAVNGSTTVNYTKIKNSVFSAFTIEENHLCDFIVTPEKVSWQEKAENAHILGFEYILPNENWSQDITEGFNGPYCFVGKQGDDAWKYDYLWLPAISETGHTSNLGLWKCDQQQRSNGALTTENSLGHVGSAAGEADSFTWMRSSSNSNASSAWRLLPNGASFSSANNFVNNSSAIRPALHLNLTKIISSLI